MRGEQEQSIPGLLKALCAWLTGVLSPGLLGLEALPVAAPPRWNVYSQK